MMGRMPTPSRRPLSEAPAKTPIRRRTVEEIAKVAVSRREHLVGDRNRVKLTLTVVLSRGAAERLVARAIASEEHTLDSLVAEILETAARPSRDR